MRLFSTLFLSVGVLVLFSGCDNTSKDSATGGTPSTTSKHDDHDHDHGDADHDHGDEDHDHADHDDHAMPHTSPVHKGHPIAVSGGEFGAEWCHSSSNDVIDIYVLNKEGTADMPIKAESIKVRQKNVEDPETFELAAVEPDAEGRTAHFSLDSQRLNIAMTQGVEVIFEFDGKTATAEIPPHKAH